MIQLASQHEVHAFAAEIAEVLSVLGYTEYLITDRSTLADFPHDAEDLTYFRVHFGITVDPLDRLADIGARLRAHRR